MLYKDPAAAYKAFAHDADYTRPIGLEQDEAFAFWNYGPELSRPFRALDLWLLLKHVGAKRLGEAIAENIACAEYLQDLNLDAPSALLGFQLGGIVGHKFLSKYRVGIDLEHSVLRLKNVT